MIRIRARTRDPNAIDVAVHDVDRHTFASAKKRHELIGNHHRTMPATGAADGDREVALSFAFETRQAKIQQGRYTVEKPATVRLRQDEIFHDLRAARQLTQLRDEVGVVQKTHVE